MIITCQECNSSFNVEDSLIKETGSKVRCSKCENIFVAYPQSAVDDLLLGLDEQPPDANENLKLDDIDSPPDDFSDEEESFETVSSPEDADDELGIGLGLDPQPVREEEPEEFAENANVSDGTMADFENTTELDEQRFKQSLNDWFQAHFKTHDSRLHKLARLMSHDHVDETTLLSMINKAKRVFLRKVG